MPDDIVLASASPTRSALLAAAGCSFVAEPAAIDEAAVKTRFRGDGRTALDCAFELAEAKARRVSARRPGALVIGADQILVLGAAWLDKPADAASARSQLQSLRGCTHELVTAACVVRDGERLWYGSGRASLTMRAFGDRFLNAYLAAEGPAALGSVGAYRVEGRGIQLFSRIDGDYFAILGLPLLPLLDFLRGCGALCT